MRIRKWYADCVATDGTLVIAYAARLGAGPFTLPYQAVLTGERGRPVAQRATLAAKGMPTLADQRATWHAPALNLAGAWIRTSPAFHQVLFDSDSVTIDWHCHMPSAEATVRVGGHRLEGMGYVEELRVHGSPRAIPLRRLLWGRFLAEGHSVVWIAWHGPEPLTLVLHNGVRAEDGAVDAGAVRWQGFHLTVDGEGRWTLRDELVEASVFPERAWLRPLVPRALARVREVKWAARGSLQGPEGPAVGGWAIFEEVVWP
jgi:hypothetical protein